MEQYQAGGIRIARSESVGSGRVRVGCSGWSYAHWRGSFYRPEWPRSRWFEHYAATFDTVEINNSFYRLPEAATFEAWARKAPRQFLFAVKASRFLTHMKKLREPQEALDRFFDRARQLGSHLGPVLYQLPPMWKRDSVRLEQFLQVLPRDARHVFEFREPSWYADEIFELLTRYGASLCLHDMPGSASGRMRVGPVVYIRFHGAGARYGGRYRDDQLEAWAEWLMAETLRGTDVYAYFNNDVGGHAPPNALTLRALLERRPATRPRGASAGRRAPASSRP